MVGGHLTVPDHIVTTGIELVGAGRPDLVPPTGRFIEERHAIERLPAEGSLLYPAGKCGSDLVLYDDCAHHVGVILRIVVRNPVNVPSSSAIVKPILRS